MTLSNLRTANSLVENATRINQFNHYCFNKGTFDSEHVRFSGIKLTQNCTRRENHELDQGLLLFNGDPVDPQPGQVRHLCRHFSLALATVSS